jgi:hypothetical protein
VPIPMAMEPNPSPSLEIPSFLFGPHALVHRRAMGEGRRCASRYRKDGTLPSPRELLQVPPDGLVVMKAVVDFSREQPAWRLYMMGDVREGLYKALDWKDTARARLAYEESFRETAWGALHYAVTHVAPMDVGCYALRFKALLRSWDSYQSPRYLYTSPAALLTLDELMMAACGWAMEAWCPEVGASVRARLEVAAERMALATREDCIEAILRQVPRVLPFAPPLKHPKVLADPAFWHERLATLEPESFDRISSAMSANVLERLCLWDRQLELQ